MSELDFDTLGSFTVDTGGEEESVVEEALGSDSGRAPAEETSAGASGRRVEPGGLGGFGGRRARINPRYEPKHGKVRSSASLGRTRWGNRRVTKRVDRKALESQELGSAMLERSSADMRVRGSAALEGDLLERLMDTGLDEPHISTNPMEFGDSYYPKNYEKNNRGLKRRFFAYGDQEMQLRASCAALGEEYMERLRRDDIFDHENKDAYERLDKVAKQHQRHMLKYINKIRKPLENGVSFMSLSRSIGWASMLWLVSSDFRAMTTGRVFTFAWDKAPRAIQRLVPRYDDGTSQSMLLTAESAAMTFVGLKENLYDKIREIQNSTEDSVTKGMLITKAKDDFNRVMDKLLERSDELGIKERDIATYERMIIGTRAQHDPNFAAKFEGLSHGRLSRSIDKKSSVWSGSFLDAAGHTRISSGMFGIREPMSLQEHQDAINVGIQSAMEENATLGRSAGVCQLDIMAAFASISLDASTSRRMARMFPDTGFTRFSGAMHAMAQDGYTTQDMYTTLLPGVASGLAQAAQNNPEIAGALKHNLKPYHYTEEGEVDFRAYVLDMQRAGEMYGLLVRYQGAAKGQPVMSPEEFLERYQDFRKEAQLEDVVQMDAQRTHELIAFLNYDRTRSAAEKETAQKLIEDQKKTLESTPGVETKPYLASVTNEKQKEALRSFIDAYGKDYAVTLQSIETESLGTRNMYLLKKQLNDIESRFDSLVAPEDKDKLATLLQVRGTEMILNEQRVRSQNSPSVNSFVEGLVGGPDNLKAMERSAVKSLVNSGIATDKGSLAQSFDTFFIANSGGIEAEGTMTHAEIHERADMSYVEALDSLGMTATSVMFDKNVKRYSAVRKSQRNLAQRLDTLGVQYVKALAAQDGIESADGDNYRSSGRSAQSIMNEILDGVPKSQQNLIKALAVARGYEKALENYENDPLSAEVAAGAQEFLDSRGANPQDQESILDTVFKANLTGSIPSQTHEMGTQEITSYYDSMRSVGLEPSDLLIKSEQKRQMAQRMAQMRKRQHKYYTDRNVRQAESQEVQSKNRTMELADVSPMTQPTQKPKEKDHGPEL